MGGRAAAGLSIMDDVIITNFTLPIVRGDRSGSTVDTTRTLQSGIFVEISRTADNAQVSDVELNWKPESDSRLTI